MKSSQWPPRKTLDAPPYPIESPLCQLTRSKGGGWDRSVRASGPDASACLAMDDNLAGGHGAGFY